MQFVSGIMFCLQTSTNVWKRDTIVLNLRIAKIPLVDSSVHVMRVSMVMGGTVYVSIDLPDMYWTLFIEFAHKHQ